MQNCKKVTLRLRHCKHGKMSYYLDYYPPYRDKKTMKTIRHEYLGIYIYESPKNSHELAFNKTMEEKAEIIRCRRFEEIINAGRCSVNIAVRNPNTQTIQISDLVVIVERIC